MTQDAPAYTFDSPPANVPLLLSYGQPGTARHWTLSIQASPRPAVILTGDDPTRDEIISCLVATHAPVWMIPVIEVLAQVAEVQAPVSSRYKVGPA